MFIGWTAKKQTRVDTRAARENRGQRRHDGPLKKGTCLYRGSLRPCGTSQLGFANTILYSCTNPLTTPTCTPSTPKKIARCLANSSLPQQLYPPHAWFRQISSVRRSSNLSERSWRCSTLVFSIPEARECRAASQRPGADRFCKHHYTPLWACSTLCRLIRAPSASSAAFAPGALAAATEAATAAAAVTAPRKSS